MLSVDIWLNSVDTSSSQLDRKTDKADGFMCELSSGWKWVQCFCHKNPKLKNHTL